MPIVHPFFYYLPRKQPNRGLKPPQTRDVVAEQEVLAALLERGFQYGEPILNFPPPENPNRLVEEEELYPIDISFLNPGDFLLTLTRPPIHDVVHGDRKMIEAGNTDLERRIFEAWSPYLEIVARSHIKLHPNIHSEVRSGFENRRDMTFRQKHGGFYGGLNALDGRGPRQPPNSRRTAAFLLRTEELPGGGPGLINPFGMDAIMTLVWAYRLRRDFAYLLERPGFVMVEMESAPIPARPTNLRFALDWKIEPVIVIRP
jgi:hypothetical protein